MTMVINGSGTITGLTAGGLPDATIVQADLAAGVAGNGPAFSAYTSVQQTLVASTFTKVTLNQETFDTNSNFDTSVYRFLPTVAGYYQINGSVGFTAATQCLCALVKNGHDYTYGSYAGSTLNSVVGRLIYFNGSTDYVELYAFSAATPTTTSSSQQTWMTGALVRAA